MKAEEVAIAEEEASAILQKNQYDAAYAQSETANNLYQAADLDTSDLEKLRLADEAQLLADQQFEEAR